MNSFIRHITGADERIIMLARLHWIYIVSGFFWMLGLLLLGQGLDYLLWVYFGSTVPFSGQEILGIRFGAQTPVMLLMFGGCGIMMFILSLIKALATEIALTNQRLIYKTGLIFVEVEELDLVEVRAEYVHHGLLGRFLGYGRVRLDSRFVGDITLPAIKKPYRLIKAMHTARSRLSDSMEGAHRHTVKN